MTSSHTAPQLHVVRFAPAKLNLTLAVTGRRADGFHSLHSIMVPLTLGDALTVRAGGPGATSDSLRVSGIPVSSEPDNLVLRAIGEAREMVMRFQQHLEPTPAFLRTLLSKRIPVAAGLGGGSSDAAAAIEAALAAWGVVLPAQTIANLAAQIGSDVPFFLAGRGAVVTGRGELVEPLPEFEEPPAVLLVTPRVPVATAAVFKAYAGGQRPRARLALRISESLAEQLRQAPEASALLDRAPELALANDLVPAAAATAPGLADFAAGVARILDRPICQSGSGPTLWALYATLDEARKAAKTLKHTFANRELPAFGNGEPFVAATLIASNAVAAGTSDATGPADATGPTDATLATHATRVLSTIDPSPGGEE